MSQASVGFHCPACTKSGSQKTVNPFATKGRHTPFIYGVLAVIVATYLAQTVSGSGNARTGWVTDTFVLYGPYVSFFNEYWRIVTGAFLHADIIHLAMNSYFIYTFGTFMERQIGWFRTALIYAGGLLSGSAAVLLFDFDAGTLGASGAALGMGGGAVAIMASNGASIVESPLARVLAFNLVLPLLGFLNISFWGHFGGVVGGVLVGAIFGYLPTRFAQNDKNTKLAAVSAVVMLGVIAVLAGSFGNPYS